MVLCRAKDHSGARFAAIALCVGMMRAMINCSQRDGLIRKQLADICLQGIIIGLREIPSAYAGLISDDNQDITPRDSQTEGLEHSGDRFEIRFTKDIAVIDIQYAVTIKEKGRAAHAPLARIRSRSFVVE